jgi:hypothetical protein
MQWYTPHHDHLITQAVAQVYTYLQTISPPLAEQVWTWMKSLSGTDQPADYFKHPAAVPFLLLSWYAEETLHPAIDDRFQLDLAYSSVNAYYYVRLVDNLMDGDTNIDIKLLPLAGVFHNQFQKPYQRYFDTDHPFWNFFDVTWIHQADVTIQDSYLQSIDEAIFKNIVAGKICGTKIPIAAVCYRYNRPDLIPLWSKLVDIFGCWHMFWQDMFDWLKDSTHHTLTYFLSEAERRKHADESLAMWVMREGIDWGIQQLYLWSSELKTIADKLNSVHLRAYFQDRENAVQQQRTKMDSGLQLMLKLAQTLERK